MSSSFAAQPTLAVGSEPFLLTGPDVKYIFRGCVAFIVAAVIFIRASSNTKVTTNVPLINPGWSFDLANWGWRWWFAFFSQDLLKKGQAQCKNRAFKLMTDSGEIIVLPSSLVSNVSHEDKLVLRESVAEDFHAHIPGFEPFAAGTRDDQIGQGVVRKRLTRALNKITPTLSDETNYATARHFGTSKDWQRYTLYPKVLDVVCRMSTRVFLGPELCRNEDWLHITKSYTKDAFIGAAVLRAFPNWARNIVHWFIPQCRRIRVMGAKAQELITPYVLERKRLRAEAASKGLPIPDFDDAIDWFEDESGGNVYDGAIAQLGLSMAAIHTTSDLLCETLLRLARRPELIEEVREEIIHVLRTDGWKKTSLYKMKLLDSVIKEAQRLRPISLVSMVRKAVADVTLPNGDIIPKGCRTVILTDQHRSPELFDNPDEYDGHRFAKMRNESEKANTAHLVSTGPSSLGFGHGSHACPGRFFAANEMKVALCHLLVKYDWKMPAGVAPEPKPLVYSFALQADPWAEVYVKRRETNGFDMDVI